MAASNQLEESITCSICFEIYREPLALACLHTYCKQCIARIRHSSGVSCPECRVYSRNDDIRPDFKTQGLIDYYKSDYKSGKLFLRQDSEKIFGGLESIGLVNCDMCSAVKSKPAIAKCKDCDQLMCRTCSGTHGNITVCKSHRVEELNIANNSVHVNIQQAVEKLKEEKKAILREANKTDVAIGNVKKQQKEQEKEIDRLTDKFIKNLESNRNRLHQIVKEANHQCLDKLQHNKHQVDQCCLEIQDRIDYLHSTPATEDPASLQVFTAGIDGYIKTEIENIREKIRDVKTDSITQSPVTLKQGVKWDVRNLIEVIESIIFKC